MCWRFLTVPGTMCLANFLTSCLSSALAIGRFNKRKKAGTVFPPFVFISITDKCNLDCHGCWVKAAPERELDFDFLDRIITLSRKKGNRFFGILGGEPLLYERLFEIFARHRDCYFQLFTNGLLLREEIIDGLVELGNVTPLISVEGLEKESDRRRGGNGVYDSALDAVRLCAKKGLITGIATSTCKSSFADVVSGEFLDMAEKAGALYVWYYIYRPVGPRPCPEEALSVEQILELRRFMVDERCRRPMAIIDSYWDADGRALCPAATGISHHINPAGDIEPCPPLQLSDVSALPQECENLQDELQTFTDKFSSPFLQSFRREIPEKTRGCILMEGPGCLVGMAERCEATDSSGRGTVIAELKNAGKCPGHDMPGQEIPEKSWLYRFAKRHWFFGFGAYG